MKLSDNIKYSFLKTIRDKKNIYFIIIMTLCIFILIATLFFRIVYFALVDDELENNRSSRRIFVISKDAEKSFEDENYDFGYDKILNLEHVVDVYDSRYDFYQITSDTFKNDLYDGGITLAYGSEASQPKYISGERIKNNDTGVAVCSKKFYPTFIEKGLSNSDIQFVDGDNIVGTTFTTEVEKYIRIGDNFVPSGTYKKEYKIIGTFDASETRDYLNTCYISPKDIKEIKDLTDTNNYDYMISAQSVIIDKYKNVGESMNQIEKMGFIVDEGLHYDKAMLRKIKLICLIIISITTISIIFLSSLYAKKHNMNNKNEIAIMKAYGYEKKDILMHSLNKLSCLMIISFVTGIILFLIILTILKSLFSNFLLENHIYIGVYMSPYVSALIVLAITTIATNYFTINKLSKRQTLSVIKE